MTGNLFAFAVLYLDPQAAYGRSRVIQYEFFALERERLRNELATGLRGMD